MELLTDQDTQSLLQAIQELYSLRSLDSFGVAVVTTINRLVPSEVPVFHLNNLRLHQFSSTFLPSYPGFTPEMDEVSRCYWGEHPIIQNMPRTLDGAYKISDFTTSAEFHQLEGLYQQFLRLIGCEDQMTLFLPGHKPESRNEFSPGNHLLMGVSLNRSQRNFTERDRLILNLLRPHLFQAYCNVQHYQQLKQDQNELQQSFNHLSLVILNTEGKIQRATPQATAWLEIYFPKPTCSSQLPDHLWAWVKHQINGFAGEPDFVKARPPLRIHQDGKQLVIRLVAEQAAAQYLLLMEEQTLSLLKSLALLELSQRETEVLFWVMRGKDNKAIATQLSISKSTVRKHLESIYLKLGVQSRTEAIAQTLERLGLLNASPVI